MNEEKTLELLDNISEYIETMDDSLEKMNILEEIESYLATPCC